jgi:hypothetical protein
MASPSPGAASNVIATPGRINELAKTLLARIRESIKEIGDINLQARVLSINAQIEAARAGDAGRSFTVVSQEMVTFSNSIQHAAKKLEQQSEVLVLELAEISRHLATNVRGTRLGDLALTNIDLIDRNLYERSCDCRWWATDAAMVAALENAQDETARTFASQRLGVILKAYTVYFDIVLADLKGTIIANGRPETYESKGTEHKNEPWFQSALATPSGNEFGFQTTHHSSLVGDSRALVYSCKVCHGGDATGEPIGVLGVVFNWDGLAQKIVKETPIDSEKKSLTRVCIVAEDGTVLADSDDRILQEKIDFSGRRELFAEKKSSANSIIQGKPVLIAHAQSPGFETYRTGWHSLIVETLEKE